KKTKQVTLSKFCFDRHLTFLLKSSIGFIFPLSHFHLLSVQFKAAYRQAPRCLCYFYTHTHRHTHALATKHKNRKTRHDEVAELDYGKRKRHESHSEEAKQRGRERRIKSG